LRFVEGDVCDWRDEAPFDAVVGRLILFHLADPVRVLRHHLASLRPGGLMVALDFDVAAARAEPPVPVVAEAASWIMAAFHRAGADPTIGAKLAVLLAQAGLVEVQGFGIQGYLAPDDPRGPALLSGVVRTLAPAIVAAGLATAEQVDRDRLERRVSQAIRSAGSVFLPPVLAGAWGRRG
jgi:SAM-dependent methyltransferase